MPLGLTRNSIAIEIQEALGINGFAFDIPLACTSGMFALKLAHDMISAGSIRSAIIVCPEICTPSINFRDPSSHFIFGDGCSALVVEKMECVKSSLAFEILTCSLKTVYSTGIHNHFGFLNDSLDEVASKEECLFNQNGALVFRDVMRLVEGHIAEELQHNKITADKIKRFWFHQANLRMIKHISKSVCKEWLPERVPLIIREYGNTGASSTFLNFDLNHKDLSRA